MADVDAEKSLGALLNGVSQRLFFEKTELTEELLKEQLYPELPREDFTALHDRMAGLLKVNTPELCEPRGGPVPGFLLRNTRKQGFKSWTYGPETSTNSGGCTVCLR